MKRRRSIRLRHGDCFEHLRALPDHSIDAVITDPPYGTMAARWDRSPLNIAAFWELLRLKLKPNGVVVCFAAGRFVFNLHASNPRWYRYELVWEKSAACGFLDANRMPLRAHEWMMIFAPRFHGSCYRPQKVPSGKPATGAHTRTRPNRSALYRGHARETVWRDEGKRHPRSVLRFNSVTHRQSLHPTQKPLDLVRWLVRTYTRPGALVCDPFFGSGTTAEACLIEGRRFFGCEKVAKFYRRAERRLSRAA